MSSPTPDHPPTPPTHPQAPRSYAGAPFLRPVTPAPSPFPRAAMNARPERDARRSTSLRRRPERQPRRSVTAAPSAVPGTEELAALVYDLDGVTGTPTRDDAPATAHRTRRPRAGHTSRRQTAIVAAAALGLAAVAVPAAAAATRQDDVTLDAATDGHGGAATDGATDTTPDTTATEVAPAPTTAEPTASVTSAVPTTAVSTTVATTVTTPPTTARPTTTVTTSTTTRPAVTTTAATNAYSFLACVRHRESRGNYQALNPSGAAGAYQLLPATARATAQHAGRPDLAGIPVTSWSPGDQDAMAASLYQWQGTAPWGGGCY